MEATAQSALIQRIRDLLGEEAAECALRRAQGTSGDSAARGRAQGASGDWAAARQVQGTRGQVREVSMFGGRSFMVNEKMIVSVRRDGGLLVRVSADRQEDLLDEPGATRAEMGSGRSMGRGWIQVSPEAVRGDESLAFWVAVALEHNRVVARDSR